MKSGFLTLYGLRHDETHSQRRVRACAYMYACLDTLWSGGTCPEIWLEMVAAISCLHHSTWELDALGGKTMKKDKNMKNAILHQSRINFLSHVTLQCNLLSQHGHSNV